MTQNAILCAVDRFSESGVVYTEGPEDTLFLDFVNDVYAINGTNSLPVSNLASRQLSKVWRSANTDPLWTWFQADYISTTDIDVVALLNHNLSSVAKWRIVFSNDANFATIIYDTGLVNAWPNVSSFGVKPWGKWLWGEALGAPDVANYRINSLMVLPSTVTARYMRIYLSDSTNAAGYLQAGRCWAGPKYQPSTNISYGWSIGWVDESQVSRSLGGQTFVDERPRFRRIKFRFEYLPQDEAYINLFDYVDRRKGIAGDVLFIPQPDRTDLFIHEVVYGRMSEIGDITQPFFDVVVKNYVLEELL